MSRLQPGTFSQQRIEALQLSFVCTRDALILDCREDVQGVTEENSELEGACKATSQVELTVLVCTVIRQGSKEQEL